MVMRFRGARNDFKEKPDDAPLTTIFLDHGYHPDKLQKVLEQVYPEIMTHTKSNFACNNQPSP
jgi:hypothetical protein